MRKTRNLLITYFAMVFIKICILAFSWFDQYNQDYKKRKRKEMNFTTFSSRKMIFMRRKSMLIGSKETLKPNHLKHMEK